jgi:hypothetical protein
MLEELSQRRLNVTWEDHCQRALGKDFPCLDLRHQALFARPHRVQFGLPLFILLLPTRFGLLLLFAPFPVG